MTQYVSIEEYSNLEIPINYNPEIYAIINKYTVVVFSLSNCPFCNKVKDTLDKRNCKYVVYDLDKMEGEYSLPIHVGLIEITGRSSLPVVFIGKSYIGGCNDSGMGGLGGIVHLDIEGHLVDLLEEANAIRKWSICETM